MACKAGLLHLLEAQSERSNHMTNTPSKAEIEKLAAEHLKAFSQFPMGGQVWFEGEVEFARAVLAKWGTPQPVVREQKECTCSNRS